MLNFILYVLRYFKTNSNNNSNNSGNIINGKRYKGNNIVMTNGRLIIDGVDVTGDGGVAVQIDTIIIEGNVNSIKVGSSNVKCNDVTGNVETKSGNVSCQTVGENVTTMSGNVKVNEIKGSVKTNSGNVSKW